MNYRGYGGIRVVFTVLNPSIFYMELWLKEDDLIVLHTSTQLHKVNGSNSTHTTRTVSEDVVSHAFYEGKYNGVVRVFFHSTYTHDD